MLPWKLAETNYHAVKQQHYEVAVLPFGATEPHNLHLPYGMDTFEGNTVGEKICAEAHRRGAQVILLPTVPYGTQTNQAKFPFAMNVYPSTLCRIVSDLVESLVRTGIRKIVLLNSHGGNDFKWVLRELHGRTPAHLFLCNWYMVCKDLFGDIFAQADDHAGEMETSFCLAHYPELVGGNPDGTLVADEGRARRDAFRGRQPRLGVDHASLASADDQCGSRQPPCRDGREGARAHGRFGRAAGPIPGRAFRGRSGRAVPLLAGGFV